MLKAVALLKYSILYYLFTSTFFFLSEIVNCFNISFSAALLIFRKKTVPIQPYSLLWLYSVLALTQKLCIEKPRELSWSWHCFFFLVKVRNCCGWPSLILSLQKTGIPQRKNPETGVYLQALTALMHPEWFKWLMWYVFFDWVQIELYSTEPLKHWDKSDF